MSTINANSSGIVFTGNTDGTLDLATGGTTRMLIDGSGNVGIGTSSPGSKLVVGNQSAIYGGGTTNENVAIVAGVPPSVDTARGIFGVYDQTSVAAGVGGSITFGGSYVDTTQTFFAGIKGVKTNASSGDATGDLLLAPRSGNTIFYGAMYSSERMRINSSGNVGIGTSSPGAKLSVSGGSSTWAHINGGNSNTDPIFASLNNETVASATFGWLWYNPATNGHLDI
jgi:hypothetical protein